MTGPADRLRSWLRSMSGTMLVELEEALEQERRQTVGRIRNRLLLGEGVSVPEDYANKVLDEVEAAQGDAEHGPEGNEGYCVCGMFQCPKIR